LRDGHTSGGGYQEWTAAEAINEEDGQAGREELPNLEAASDDSREGPRVAEIDFLIMESVCMFFHFMIVHQDEGFTSKIVSE
jgi:hypothetical protein